MIREAIFHQPYDAGAFPVAEDSVVVRLRAARDDLVTCLVVYGERFVHPPRDEVQAMTKIGSDALFDYYQATLRGRRLRYAFLLSDGRETLWYTPLGLTPERPADTVLHFHYQYVHRRDLFTPPDWLAEAIIYQIFVDRFANGDPRNDPPGVAPWSVDARPTPTSFYGGDLQGIIDRLLYLQALGVNTLLLTPIFTAPSNHKYDPADYYQIDPHFGDLATFQDLVRRCHALGIRVVLDGVFDHCGADFGPWRDVVAHGAASRYARWFNIESFPIRTDPKNYETFAFTPSMPKLNSDHPEVRRFILETATYWLRVADIDGWRLDVAEGCDHALWREFRQAVKAVKPEAVILGELWQEAQRWLRGDQWDTVMNYPLWHAIVSFFATGAIGAETFAARLLRLQVAYPDPVQAVLVNLIGSHDTPRIRQLAQGDARRVALAAVFLFTYRGVPLVYYGDEVGLMGGPDPDCRRPMPWDARDWDQGTLALYRRLIALRRRHAVFRRGDLRLVWADAATNGFAFARWDAAEMALVVFNNSPVPRRVALARRALPCWGQPLRDVLSERPVYQDETGLRVELEPFGAAVLLGPLAPDPTGSPT